MSKFAQNTWFTVGIIVILMVSAYDVYLSIKLQDLLPETEKNPVGRWLIQIDNQDVALFMAAKLFGTGLAIHLLGLLRHYKLKILKPVMASIVLLQLALLMFLRNF